MVFDCYSVEKNQIEAITVSLTSSSSNSKRLNLTLTGWFFINFSAFRIFSLSSFIVVGFYWFWWVQLSQWPLLDRVKLWLWWSVLGIWLVWKTVNNFRASSFSFLVRENYLEFCQTSHIPRTDRNTCYQSIFQSFLIVATVFSETNKKINKNQFLAIMLKNYRIILYCTRNTLGNQFCFTKNTRSSRKGLIIATSYIYGLKLSD